MRTRPLPEKIALAEMLETRIGTWLCEGRVKPIVSRVLPLAEASKAHRMLQENDSFGKIVLQMP
jgi:NADPH:quinone reductase-like Zn-dependent oxidoreductase